LGVAKTNNRAKHLHAAADFELRDKYQLMSLGLRNAR
jgi:hypothetical protein